MVPRWLVASLLAGVALTGCSDGTPGTKSGDLAPGTGILRGVVVDDAIRPLAGAEALVEGAGKSLNLTTKADGLFAFRDLQPGVYVVKVSKPFYLAQQQAVTVRADEPEPAVAKFQLQFEAGLLPFASQIQFDGFIECSATIGNWCGIVNLYPCIVMGQIGQPCFPITNDKSFFFIESAFTDLQRAPDHLQIEAYWESTQSFSNSLGMRYAATNRSEYDQFSYGPVLATPQGPSPLIAKVNATAMAEAELGTIRGLTTELFHGAPDAAPPELEQCVPPVGCWSNQFLGVAAQQRVSIVYMAFYGYLPPEDWTFFATGAIPPPA